jgi:uncharacterized membrane protein YccC
MGTSSRKYEERKYEEAPNILIDLLRSVHSLTKYYSVTEAHGEVLCDVEHALNQAIERLQNMEATEAKPRLVRHRLKQAATHF